MFNIKTVRTPRLNVQFSPRTNSDSHRISVVTGVNGAGKTELLTAVASCFLSEDLVPKGVFASWDRDGLVATTNHPLYLPTRVIAQTFSPFSRFAASDDDSLTLTDIYADGRNEMRRYRTIGLHKKSRYVGGSLSKQILELGLFRLSEAPEHTRALADVLEALGFHDHIRLVYRKYPGMQEILHAHRDGSLRRHLDLISDYPTRMSDSRLGREVRVAGSGRLAELLASAIEVLAEQLNRSSFEIFLSFTNGRRSEDFAVLQALALLRRLRVLRLAHCELVPMSGTGSVDIANSSSGQQQMLSSIFGLTGELRSDSLVLIDEPELSLHPNWQMLFLDQLRAVLRPFRGCHVIIATHSPLIVQSALQAQLEVIQLQPYHETTGYSDLSLPRQSHLSVEGALLEVFHTPISDSVYLANEIFDIVAEDEDQEGQMRESTLKRLDHLRSVYSSKGVNNDGRALGLIDQAIKVVRDLDEDNANGI